MRWQMECVLRKGVGLHKRTGPSLSYRIVGKWYRGDKFVAVDVKTVGKYTWYKIEGTKYWSCGKEGSAVYLKKIKDLDPPKPPKPKPPKPKPKPDLPPPKPKDPPWVGPDYGNSKVGSGWGYNGINSWYVSSDYIRSETSTNMRKAMNPSVINYGSYQTIGNTQLEKELRRIRYNMDIAYMNRDEVNSKNGSTGYFSDLQYKINMRFNRNKTAFADYHLNKTFAYVFFTRPDLNLCYYKDSKWQLTNQAKMDAKFNYLFNNNPLCLRSLVSSGNPNHKFLVLLSNEARSFEVSDKVLKSIEHGETFTGGKVTYGRTDHETNTAGEMSIRYIDSVNLDIYKIHEAWTDYINNVSRGKFSPKKKYIHDRILDYACSCYYFLCGADGSTILYWQKLTGVYPVNTGENAFSWDAGTLLAKPEINIKYNYAMKSPLDVAHLHEFNKLVSNGHLKSIKKTYERENVATGSTLSHSPYIADSTENGRRVYRLVWLNN